MLRYEASLQGAGKRHCEARSNLTPSITNNEPAITNNNHLSFFTTHKKQTFELLLKTIKNNNMKTFFTLLFVFTLGVFTSTVSAVTPTTHAANHELTIPSNDVAIVANFQALEFDYLILTLPSMGVKVLETNESILELKRRMDAVDTGIALKFISMDEVQNCFTIHPILFKGKDQRFKFNYMLTLREYFLFKTNSESFDKLPPFRLCNAETKEVIASWHIKTGFLFGSDITGLPAPNLA